MKYLIVNADDFGYSPGVNKGIIHAHTDGIVTSTSVMVDAVAASEAADLNKYTGLAVGLHFVTGGSGSIRDELDRQINKFIAITGRNPIHIDIHKVRKDDHELKQAVSTYAKEHNIHARYSGNVKFLDSFFGPHADGNVSVSQLKKTIDQATESYNELMCHVGYADDYLKENSTYSDLREQELDSICSKDVAAYIETLGLKLTNWAAVDSSVESE